MLGRSSAAEATWTPDGKSESTTRTASRRMVLTLQWDDCLCSTNHVCRGPSHDNRSTRRVHRASTECTHRNRVPLVFRRNGRLAQEQWCNGLLDSNVPSLARLRTMSGARNGRQIMRENALECFPPAPGGRFVLNSAPQLCYNQGDNQPRSPLPCTVSAMRSVRRSAVT